MKKLIIALLISLLILSGCSNKADNKISLTNEDEITLELGQVALSLDPDDYVTYDNETINSNDIKVSLHYAALSKDDEKNVITTPMTKELETSDLNRVTDYVLVISYEDETLQKVIHIKDTTAPKITDFKDNYTITEGDDLPDIKADVKAEDLSDVTIDIDTSNVKTDKPGEYKVTITAIDTSDNKTEKEVTVIVEKKPEVTVQKPSTTKPSSGSGSSSKPSGGSSSGGLYHTGSYVDDEEEINKAITENEKNRERFVSENSSTAYLISDSRNDMFAYGDSMLGKRYGEYEINRWEYISNGYIIDFTNTWTGKSYTIPNSNPTYALFLYHDITENGITVKTYCLTKDKVWIEFKRW